MNKSHDIIKDTYRYNKEVLQEKKKMERSSTKRSIAMTSSIP